MIKHEWISPDGVTLVLTDAASGVRLLTGAVEGLGDGESVDFTQDRTVLDGQTFAGFRTKARDCFWPILIDGNVAGWETQQRAFWSALPPGRYGTWRVTTPGGSVRTLKCRYVPGTYTPDVDPSETLVEQVGISLIADDPAWRGALVQKQFQTGQTPTPFYSTSGSTLFLMSGNTVDNATLTNPGELDSWGQIRVNGPATSFSVALNFANGNIVAGNVVLSADQYLLIDTDPAVQTVRRYNSDGSFDVVFDQMTNVDWRPFPAGASVPVYITLVGSGSVTVSFYPRYRRAY